MESYHLRLRKLLSMHAHAYLVGHCMSGSLQADLSACSSPVVFAPIYITKFLWSNKSSSSTLLDLLSQQPSSLINAIHEDIRVSMPSLRLQFAKRRPEGCWELDDGTEDPLQDTQILPHIVSFNNLIRTVSYLVCSFQASNNKSGFPFRFIIMPLF